MVIDLACFLLRVLLLWIGKWRMILLEKRVEVGNKGRRR